MARKHASDDVGEVGVVLHFSKHCAAEDYFLARVAVEAFVDGLLFERVKPSFDFFAAAL